MDGFFEDLCLNHCHLIRLEACLEKGDRFPPKREDQDFYCCEHYRKFHIRYPL